MFGPSRSQRIVELAIRWLVLAFAVWAAAEVVPGIHLSGWQSTLAVAAILGALNLLLRPILVTLAIPITILTLGLFLIVINAAMFYLTSWLIENISDLNRVRFHVENFGDAVLGALVISVVTIIVGLVINPRDIARSLGGPVRV